MVKKKKFQTVALFSSKINENTMKIASQIDEVLNSMGIEVLFTDSFSSQRIKKNKLYSNKYIIKKSDLLIAIGGDGTLLSSARIFGSNDLPILGVNLGNIGFLTDINPENLTSSLIDIINGNFIKDERFLLNALVNNQQKNNIALNEVVIHSGLVAQLIEYELFIDNEFVYRQKSDGLIISSPTGSTAYSMSAGGPIIHPSLNSINIVPMSPHSLNTRSLVIESTRRISIRLLSKKGAKLSLDSHNILPLKHEDEVTVLQDDSRLNLIHPVGHNFYDACRNKLNWSSVT